MTRVQVKVDGFPNHKWCGVFCSAVADTRSPLFVTWEKEVGGRWQLRGCIGTFDDQFLYSALPEYALERYAD